MHRDGKTHPIAFIEYRDCQRNHTVEVLSRIVAHPFLTCLLQFGLQQLPVSDSSVRMPDQVKNVQYALTHGSLHIGQKQFSGCRAIEGQMRAHGKMDSVRPVGLYTIEINNFVSIQHGQVAGFTNLF